LIKGSAERVDVARVRTHSVTLDAEPLPPLLPTTVGWRWPWLVGTLVLTLIAGVLFVRTLPMAAEFGTDSDSRYTAWVYSPCAGVFFLAFAAGILTMIVLSFRRWRQPTRNAIFAVFAVGSLAGGAWAVHESAARKHIGGALLSAVNHLPAPAGTTPAGPAVVAADAGFPLDEVLGEPSASRTWTLPTDSAAGACAAVNQMLAGESGWQPNGAAFLCEFTRRQGRVVLRITDNELGSKADQIEVFAYPDD
jgi:hypothetical protein